ncbi:lipoprotein-releasing system ATP-binding protein LolD [Bryobacterales bacterium F-183]|nr:lipoprotein-releasing system ATP-binding protein LolD [Bryobacterales bacterium F-183]
MLRVEGLAKRYQTGKGELVVLEGLDMQVETGERIAVTGESGAGKSTILYLLGGLDRPTAGKILFDGQDITALPDAKLADYRNQSVGFVWQNHSLLPDFSALENVMMPLLIRGVPQEDAAQTARAALGEVGLSNRESHRAGELSGGEQQRVSLARALAGKPRLLLADEPTGNLDAKTGEMVMSLLEDLQRSRNLSFLYITHNPQFAARADRMVHLEKGVAGAMISQQQRQDFSSNPPMSEGGGTHV